MSARELSWRFFALVTNFREFSSTERSVIESVRVAVHGKNLWSSHHRSVYAHAEMDSAPDKTFAEKR